VSRPLGSTPTPASRDLSATTGRSAGGRRVGTQCLRFLPRHAPSRDRGLHPGRRIGARLLTFRARAADQAHAASTPGTAWPIHGHPPDSSLGMKQDPRFRCRLNRFDASMANARSSLPGRASLERLPGPHLTRSSRAFSLTLTTTVFSQRSTGWFSACPRRPTLEGQQASISRTAPPMTDVSYTTPPSAFVTHASPLLRAGPPAHPGSVLSPSRVQPA
jgi:hypothetical protein